MVEKSFKIGLTV